MLRFKNLQRRPPHGFKYRDSDTGAEFSGGKWHAFLGAITAHREANGLPPITAEAVQDQNCRKLGSATDEFCESDDPILRTMDGVSLGWRDILAGTTVLAAFKLAGSPVVAQEEAEQRAAICARCEWNVEYRKPCGDDCPELADLVQKIVGHASTSHDAQLKACGICKCSGRSNVWLPVEISRRGVTDEQMAMFPAHCWKKQQIEALAKA